MKRRTKAAIVITLLALFGLVGVCMENGRFSMQSGNTPPIAANLSWTSPKVLAAQGEWNSLVESFGNTGTKENAAQRTAKLDDVLRKHLSDDDLGGLAASAGELPLHEKDRSSFENSLLDYMIVEFTKTGDRKNLVKLLSTRCPNQLLLHTDIEYLLVIAATYSSFTDPILILGEAYSQCKIPEVKHDIATSVRRGFATMHVSGLAEPEQGDDECVSNAMKWYKTHKEELTPNKQYTHNATMFRDDYPYPLFKWKTPPTTAESESGDERS